jgi:hypothetical protein
LATAGPAGSASVPEPALARPVASALTVGGIGFPASEEDLLAQTRSLLRELRSQSPSSAVARAVLPHLQQVLESVRIGRLDLARSELSTAQRLVDQEPAF